MDPALPDPDRAPSHPAAAGQTPWQTVGPYFHYALPWQVTAVMVGPDTPGERIAATGRVLDMHGRVVPDAMVEVWQADSAGAYHHPDDPRAPMGRDRTFLGFGRSPTGENGVYRFETIMPGRVPGPGNSWQAPHLALSVFGRGLLRRLVTRLYFENSDGLDEDPVLSLVPAGRRHTLIARERRGEPHDPPGRVPHVAPYRDPHGRNGEELAPAGRVFVMDIRLQGRDETVFFDF